MAGGTPPGENRVRIKGRKQSVLRFLLISNGFTIVWIVLLSQMAYYSKLYGPQVLLQMNIAYFVPSIPVLVLFGHVERLLDAQLGPTMSMLSRITFGMLGCALLCAWFPFIPQRVFNLLLIVAALGSFSAIAFSTTYQLVSWFRSADTIALGIGCVASGPVALIIQVALQIGPRPKHWQWVAMFEMAAGLVVLGLLAALSLMYQYWPILSGKAKPESQPLLADEDRDGDGVEVMADDLLLAAAFIHRTSSYQNYVWSTPGAISSFMVPRLEYQIKSGVALRRAASADSDLAFADWQRPVVHSSVAGSSTVPRRAQTASRAHLSRLAGAAAAAGLAVPGTCSASSLTGAAGAAAGGSSSSIGSGDATTVHNRVAAARDTTAVQQGPASPRAAAAAAAAALGTSPGTVVVASPHGVILAASMAELLGAQSAPGSVALLEPSLGDESPRSEAGPGHDEELSTSGYMESQGREKHADSAAADVAELEQQPQQQQQQQGLVGASSRTPEQQQQQQVADSSHQHSMTASTSCCAASSSSNSAQAGKPLLSPFKAAAARRQQAAAAATAAAEPSTPSAPSTTSESIQATTEQQGGRAPAASAADQDAGPSTPPAAAALVDEESLAAVTWLVFKQIWTAVMAALLASTLLNWVFPFFTYVPSSGMFGEQLPQVLFYIRMLADILGRMLPRRKALAITNPLSLFTLALLLMGVGALFFAYLSAPMRLQYDLVPLVLVAVLWVGGGYVNTMSYILAPSLVEGHLCTKASALMALVHQTSHIVGLALAIGLALWMYGDIAGDL